MAAAAAPTAAASPNASRGSGFARFIPGWARRRADGLTTLADFEKFAGRLEALQREILRGGSRPAGLAERRAADTLAIVAGAVRQAHSALKELAAQSAPGRGTSAYNRSALEAAVVQLSHATSLVAGGARFLSNQAGLDSAAQAMIDASQAVGNFNEPQSSVARFRVVASRLTNQALADCREHALERVLYNAGVTTKTPDSAWHPASESLRAKLQQLLEMQVVGEDTKTAINRLGAVDQPAHRAINSAIGSLKNSSGKRASAAGAAVYKAVSTIVTCEKGCKTLLLEAFGSTDFILPPDANSREAVKKNVLAREKTLKDEAETLSEQGRFWRPMKEAVLSLWPWYPQREKERVRADLPYSLQRTAEDFVQLAAISDELRENGILSRDTPNWTNEVAALMFRMKRAVAFMKAEASNNQHSLTVRKQIATSARQSEELLSSLMTDLPESLRIELNQFAKISCTEHLASLRQEGGSLSTPESLKFSKAEKQLTKALDQCILDGKVADTSVHGISAMQDLFGEETVAEFLRRVNLTIAEGRKIKALIKDVAAVSPAMAADEKRSGRIYVGGLGVKSFRIAGGLEVDWRETFDGAEFTLRSGLSELSIRMDALDLFKLGNGDIQAGIQRKLAVLKEFRKDSWFFTPVHDIFPRSPWNFLTRDNAHFNYNGSTVLRRFMHEDEHGELANRVMLNPGLNVDLSGEKFDNRVTLYGDAFNFTAPHRKGRENDGIRLVGNRVKGLAVRGKSDVYFHIDGGSEVHAHAETPTQVTSETQQADVMVSMREAAQRSRRLRRGLDMVSDHPDGGIQAIIDKYRGVSKKAQPADDDGAAKGGPAPKATAPSANPAAAGAAGAKTKAPPATAGRATP